jgi:trehalose 6-phosphate phosphatase
VPPDPALPVELATALARLREAPEDATLLFDFDGTLSPVVDDPARATAPPEVRDLLGRLVESYGAVAVVSGRPVAFLARNLPPEVVLSGLYGLEARVEGRPAAHPAVAEWAPRVEGAADRLLGAAGPGGPIEGVVVEPKGVSITLHWRTRPELQDAAMAVARSVADAAGLEVRPAKMSAELHPPVAVDKGTAVLELLGGRRRALFVGDDVGDLPALAALDALADAGGLDHLVTVAVGGPEAPPELRAAASHRIGSQSDVVHLLGALLPERLLG